MRLDLPISQQTCAGLPGLTPAHVSRVFKDFEARGLLEYERRSIEILDFSALMRLGRMTEEELSLLTLSGNDYFRQLAG